MSLAQVLSRVVFTDVGGMQVLAGRHTIRQLGVGGNLVVDSVNGINVVDLDKAVLKKHGDYSITGEWCRGSHLLSV